MWSSYASPCRPAPPLLRCGRPFTNSSRPTPTLCYARRTQAEDFRSLNVEEIDAKVEQLKKDLFELRIKFAKRSAEWKPSNVKDIKHTVAQLLTVRREKEIAEGISKRDSRRRKVKKLLDAGFRGI